MSGRRAPIVPRFLEPGGRIAVAAPSGVVDPGRLAGGLAYLARRGHETWLAPNARARHGYLAGEDEARAEGLNEAILSRGTDPILFVRGGYGLTRILDQVALEDLRRRPRLLLGYSDYTALAMALQRPSPYLAFYGPNVSEMGEPKAFDERSLWAALRGEPEVFRLAVRRSQVLRSGRGSGVLIGGCLSLLVSLLGTPFDPDYRGAILFWEEVGEEPYRIDRMLTQLSNAGKFDHLRGMVVGGLTGCVPAPGKKSLTLRQIVQDLSEAARFPVVWRVRAGHVQKKLTLPLGIPASLDTYRGSLVWSLPRRQRV